MTGYARAEGVVPFRGQEQAWRWCWELKCVNGRGLEVRFRLPAGTDGLEQRFRAEISGQLRRGTVSANLSLQPLNSDRTTVRINRPLLDAVLVLRDELAVNTGTETSLRFDSLLTIPGMIEPDRDDNNAETVLRLAETHAIPGLKEAVASLQTMRAAEGQRLRTVLSERVTELDALRRRAERQALTQIDMLRARIGEQIQLLMDTAPGLSEDRMAAEIAILATRADVREEIDRLSAHLHACRDLLRAEEPVGRRLDFLCQEINREANTICSKSVDIGLTQTGLDIKAATEQLREQVQNVE